MNDDPLSTNIAERRGRLHICRDLTNVAALCGRRGAVVSSELVSTKWAAGFEMCGDCRDLWSAAQPPPLVDVDTFDARMWEIHRAHAPDYSTTLHEAEWTALALAGEGGELIDEIDQLGRLLSGRIGAVANAVKKGRRRPMSGREEVRGLDMQEKLRLRSLSELADVFLYATLLARVLGSSLGETLALCQDQVDEWDAAMTANPDMYDTVTS